MNVSLIQYKEIVIKTIREYFYCRGFHEVFIPLLHPSVPLEPNIYPFTTVWDTAKNTKQLYLSTSPESALKQYVAGGEGNCFAIAPAFRNFEDISPTHTPEFLMLEWYRLNSSCIDIMKETQKLILYICKKCHSSPPVGGEESSAASRVAGLDPCLPAGRLQPMAIQDDIWKTYSMIDLFQKFIGVSLLSLLDDKKMIALAKTKGYVIKNASWEQLFNQLFLNEVEPRLGLNPCFIADYPSRISPLCKPKKDDPVFAERFELYINGIEIANGNTENTDIESVRKVFLEENQWRKNHNKPSLPIDELFLGALKKLETKHVSGVGLGIDRLAMVLSGIRDVREFEPTMRVSCVV